MAQDSHNLDDFLFLLPTDSLLCARRDTSRCTAVQRERALVIIAFINIVAMS
jgi:hypothetical protein